MGHKGSLICLLLACLLVQCLCLPVRAEGSAMELSEEIPDEVIQEIIEETEEEITEEFVEETDEEIQDELAGEDSEWEEEIPEEAEPTEPDDEIPDETISETPEETVPEETLPSEEEAGRTVYEKVPLYFQTDYPDVYYGEGTVATSGCSVTSLAMVANFLTGYDYTPEELARYFAYYGDNNMERLEYGSEMLELPFKKNWDWRITRQALAEGKIAIVLMNEQSHFTQSQHFIVLTGLTEDGKILVNDPYEPNYTHWALKQGFETGFEEWEIISGFSGAWVYDPGKMPEEPLRYSEPEPEDYGPVPLYFQNEYPNTRYASGTVETSGCSVTSLAMVASYMTGHEYLPDELARYIGGRAENHMARIEYGSDLLELPYEKNTNWHTTLKALREGKIAIVLVDDKTAFTQSQHFLVLTGLTKDGRVMVNDSWEPNYTHWALEDGFINGFAPDDIMEGFQGAWVYDRAAMPEDPVLYYEPAPIRGVSRYDGVQLTLEEEDMLAGLIWAEARGECPDGQQAVAEVVLNRLVSEDFADSLRDVIYGENQFRGAQFIDDAELGQAQYEALEAAMYGPNILPMDVYYFATWETNSNVWGQIGNHFFCYAEE